MRSKKPKPVPVESAPPALPSAIAKNTAVQDPHQEPTHHRTVLEKFDPPHLNVDKEEFGQDVAEHNLKTLQDSRWAKDDPQGGQHSSAQRDSRRANVFRDAPPERNPARGNAEKKFRRKKDPRRDVAEHDCKTPTKNQRWAKEDEAPRELPRVHVDKEEFSRDVAEDNLKTLKDSRWA
ncbi:hypothetical protein F4824DRAFT_455537 [Ustulina deusta]|nr:hypothetical protein F4824DRAFT_455537 [Ustulina deusta]